MSKGSREAAESALARLCDMMIGKLDHVFWLGADKN